MLFEGHRYDFTKTAFLNWRFFRDNSPNSFFTLGEGYIMSAVELLKNSIDHNDDKRADILIFPILHNFNHGLELYLKGLLWTTNLLLQNGRELEGNHNIQQIFFMLRSRIEEYKNGQFLKGFNEDFKPLRLYMEELYQNTKGNDKNDQMDFSRYPLNKHNLEHFYIIQEGNVEIDLITLTDRIEIINKSLVSTSELLFWLELKQDS